MCFRARKGAVLSQLCPTLCDPTDDSLPGSLVSGDSQPRILEWVPLPFSGGRPHPGIKPGSPTLQIDSLPSEPMGKQEKDRCFILLSLKPELKFKKNLLTTCSIVPIDVCTYCKYGVRKNTIKNIQILPNSKALETYCKRKSLYHSVALNCVINAD